MLLFLSRTKLPGRQPSEVKFRSRPRLYNCGLVALEVDRLFQAHKGNHVHRLPHGTNRICVPTGNWFYSRVINPGTLAGNGKQQICRSRVNGCCSRATLQSLGGSQASRWTAASSKPRFQIFWDSQNSHGFRFWLNILVFIYLAVIHRK